MIIDGYEWRSAIITQIILETPRIKTFRLSFSEPYSFIAGQYCLMRMKLNDGFEAIRQYSFSSAPASGNIDITVARQPGGEISNWLHDYAGVGTHLEISTAYGSVFQWKPELNKSLLLIGGGVGMTPLISIIREHHLSGSNVPVATACSVKTEQDIPFKGELGIHTRNKTISFTFTQKTPANWKKLPKRFDSEALRPLINKDQIVYICGSGVFVSNITETLYKLGVMSDQIMSERFS